MEENIQPTGFSSFKNITEKKSYFVSFKVALPSGVIEGDLVADVEKLSMTSIQEIKAGIVQSIVRNNKGVLVPGMRDPIILAIVLLDE